MKYLGNAFSIQMLNVTDTLQVSVTKIQPEEVPAEAMSVIGHMDTANVVSTILGRPVEMNRKSVKLSSGDELYVAQLVGGRLPEGATTIPEGMKMEFYKISI